MKRNIGQVLEKIALRIIDRDNDIFAAVVIVLISGKRKVLLEVFLVKDTKPVGPVAFGVQCHRIALAKRQRAAVDRQLIPLNLIQVSGNIHRTAVDIDALKRREIGSVICRQHYIVAFCYSIGC